VAARRRQVRDTAYLLLAIVLAIVGQGFIANRDASPTPGIVLYAIAVLLTTRVAGSLFSGAEPKLIEATDAAGSPLGWNWPRRLMERPIAGMAAGAGLCLLLALIIFETRQGPILNLAWVLYLAGMVVGLLAAWRLDKPLGRGQLVWTRRDWLSLGAVLLIGAVYRLWHIGQEPAGLWYDEAAHGLDVIHLLSDPGFRPVWLNTLVPEAALHWYFDAIFFALLGPSIFALRISAIIAGVVAVGGSFLLARQLFGWRTGVVAGAFLAVASWHVNFSRVMFNAIWSVSLDLLAAYFLVKALRTNRYRDFALSGLCLGIGLNNYYTSRLFAGVLFLYLVYRLARERLAFLHRSGAGIVVLGIFVLLSAGPLMEFALFHPDQFNARLGTASVFGEISQTHSLKPLIDNVRRHVFMFNYAGDPNGRHNLSGSPELDQVMAALFVLGLALALRRVKRPEFALPLIWLPIILSGGILSLNFEAPQSLRTIDNSVVTVLFAAIPLGALWSRLTWLNVASLPLPRRVAVAPVAVSLGAVVALALFGWSAVLDYHKYFVLQYENGRTWAEYDTPQTEIGREVAQIDLNTTDVYLSSIFISEPTITFLAPNLHQQTPWDPAKELPFRGSHAAAVFLSNTDDRSVIDIQRFYPNATVRVFGAPDGSPPGLYAVYVSASDAAALHGLAGDYYAGFAITGKPSRTVRDPQVDFNFAQAKPPVPIPFVASWHGVVAAPQVGNYLLKVQGPATSKLYVDENLVVQGSSQSTVPLAEGLHAIRLESVVDEPQAIRLLWQPPGTAAPVPIPSDDLFAPPASARGLLGKYYQSPAWQGQPAKEQIDPTLKYNFHLTPLPRPYSVDWTGKLDIPVAGVYSFATDSVDSSWIYLDGKLVATNQGQPDRQGQGAVRLTEGMHDVEIKFQDLSGFSYLTIYWQPPGFQREVLPSSRLFPPQGSYPERAGPIKQINVQPSGGTGLPVPLAQLGQPIANPAPNPAGAPAASAPAAIGPLPSNLTHQVQAFGEPGTGPNQLKSPRGVAVDPQGDVYVVDTDNVRIEKLDPSGKLLTAWGAKGDGPDQFQEPVDLVVDPDGNVDVLDSTTGWVKRFSPDGKFVAQFGGPSLATYHPRAIAVDAAGNLFIADAGNSHVDELSATGAVLQKFGDHGTAPGQLIEPVGVAVGADGSIWVADTGTNRLTHFDSTFHFVQAWPIPKATSVLGPKVLIAADQTVYVTDPEGQRAIHFDATGQPTDQVGAAGELRHPVGIREDASGHLFIADADAGRVFEYGTP
jgi:streptogramin lyase